MRQRPEIGTKTVKRVSFDVCKECGCVAGEFGFCSYGCVNDYRCYGDKTFTAVYLQTMEFLGDEE